MNFEGICKMKSRSEQEKIISTLIEDNIYTKKHLVKVQCKSCQKHGGSFYRNIDLLKTYHKLLKNKEIKRNPELEKLLVMKQVRSLSGIVVVSVLTKPYDCPGKCLYCPSQANVPKSYLSNEPAVMRAIALNYDPFVQTIMRLKALEMEGHSTDKINIRVIGGTWSYYPIKYREWFIERIFEACNNLASTQLASLEEKSESQAPLEAESAPIKRTSFFDKRVNLSKLQKQNETAKHRIVEISIETRQDFINDNEIKRLRKLGVTKVELGVQSIYDDVLALNLRGNDTKETIRATKMLKDSGFKVSYQMMPNLYGANITSDKKMFKELFSNSDFKPDHLKIYPLALVKESKLYDVYKEKKFKPYTKEQLIGLLKNIKKQIPYYLRIERIIRDIPSESIVEGGTKFSNMRQVLQKELNDENTQCKCIRCREVKDALDDNDDVVFFQEKYLASEGVEYFLSFENKKRTKLYSLLRLRIPSSILKHKKHFMPALDNSSLIREIHTYGKQVEISKKDTVASQHKGLGKILISKAEAISKENGLKKISVISGVGVRGYFRKLGYNLEDTYMVKKLDN